MVVMNIIIIIITELELIRFWHFTFVEIVWHLSTQVNNALLAA